MCRIAFCVISTSTFPTLNVTFLFHLVISSHPSFSFFLNSWTKVCNNGEKTWPRRAGSLLMLIRGRKLTMHRYAINFYKIRKMKMKKPFLPHPPKCIFHLFIKFQPDHVLRNSIVSEKAGQETADPAARLYKLSSIRSFRFPVGSRAHRHTHMRAPEIKRGIYSVSALCNRKTGSRFVARFEGKSRGGRRLVIACTTRNKNTAARRRGMEIFWPSSRPLPPLVAVQIRSDLPPN